ncbi:MAG: CinA family protein [Christensenellales bacterium]
MSEGEERLRSAAKAVSEIMLDGKFRLSLAESFTGGAVSAALVGIAGTSGFLLESAVCYSNEAKCLRLGVKKETLASYGAVSPEVAEEMVKGLLTSPMRPDFAAATTGNAGPGVEEKSSAGECYVAAGASDGRIAVKRLQLLDSRENNITAGAAEALYLLLEIVKKQRGL